MINFIKKSRLLTFVFLLLWSSACMAQTPHYDCSCPASYGTPTTADTIFRFSSGESIALCGYRMQDEEQTLFSEFVLTVCGADTTIDFWDAVTVCAVSLDKDTVSVQHIAWLPAGENFALMPVPFFIENLYFLDNRLMRNKKVNRAIKRYNEAEINMVLNEHSQADTVQDEGKMLLASKLYVAAISGSSEARLYFSRFRERFGIDDGAYSEEYHFLESLLRDWDNMP